MITESTRILLLATNNPGKLEEMHGLLADLQGWKLASPNELGLDLDVEETGSSYRENAALKARAFAEASGQLALADDSGLELEALNGAPGLYSARYSPKKNATAADRRHYLLSQLERHPRPWRARFTSTVCLARPGGELHFAEGECLGEIIPKERGDFGFGYDPIFAVEGAGKTMAELAMAEKNKLSHRAHAIEAIKAQVRTLSA